MSRELVPQHAGAQPEAEMQWLYSEQWLRLSEKAVAEGKEIEEDIVEELVKRHEAWIEGLKTDTQ